LPKECREEINTGHGIPTEFIAPQNTKFFKFSTLDEFKHWYFVCSIASSLLAYETGFGRPVEVSTVLMRYVSYGPVERF